MPALSLISPVYNCARFLRRCYYTLQRQTFQDWEWIMVNDGSTDDFEEVVNSIRDERIRVAGYPANRGRGYARKLALDMSRGDWMVVWDVDDMYFPDRLESINRARLAGYDFCCSYALVVDNGFAIKGVRGFHPRSPGLPRYFVHHTLGCRLELARSIGYDPALRVAEDATITWVLDENYRGCFIDEALTIYQEDREVNIEKAIQANESQLAQLRKLYRQRSIKADAIERLVLLTKWQLKLTMLRCMRLMPGLYTLTVPLRSYGSTAEGWRLSPERLAFIETLRSGAAFS
jgi:glycosyltransferase involved in cell wall biosynthesis